MKKRLYVISGITGMTGNELAHQIMNSTMDEIIGFDNFFASSMDTISDLTSNERFIFFPYSINDEKQMSMLQEIIVSKRKEELIYINCAAVVHTEHFYRVEDTFQTNVLGMRSFLQQAIEVKADIFINCSTSEVYSMESSREGGVREDDFIKMTTAEHSQRTSYATGKLMTEFFMKEAVSIGKIKGCSIRFANVYSKNELLPKHIIPHIISSLKSQGAVTLLENAKTTKRTFLHNVDSCSAVLALVNSEKSLDGSVYNVATQEEISILDLVDLIAQEMKIGKPKILFEGIRQADPPQRILNTTKIKIATGWQPIITLKEGLRQCVENTLMNVERDK